MSQKTAGVHFKAGKSGQFIGCTLNHFEESNRWFLGSLIISNKIEKVDKDEAFIKWIHDNSINNLVLDIPLSMPICSSCTIECPGERNCQVEEVVNVRNELDFLLKNDFNESSNHPKEYERKREEQKYYDHHSSVLGDKNDGTPLSKSLKRRLKRGYRPYWNRPIDFFIWKKYYDYLLKLFNYSYDSFGQISLMINEKFSYIRRHFPSDLSLYESNVQVCLVELLRAKIISEKNVIGFRFVDDQSIDLRRNIVQEIEKNLNIFVYQNDSELLINEPKALNAFILAIAGQSKLLNRNLHIPKWCLRESESFIVPASF